MSNSFLQKPVISKLSPASGPKSGGTRITLSGDDLGVGTRNIKVYITDIEGDKLECTNPKVVPDVGLFVIRLVHIDRTHFYTPQKLCGGVFCFHVVRACVRVCVCPCIRPSVTFCFF